MTFVFQMGADERPTQTCYEGVIAFEDIEENGVVVQINFVKEMDNIVVKEVVDKFLENLGDKQYVNFEHKKDLLQNDKIIKCIIQDVGCHGNDKYPYKIFLATQGNFDVEEIAHIEEFDCCDLKQMNRLFAIIPCDNNCDDRPQKIKFWNANFAPQEFQLGDSTSNNVFLYTNGLKR